MTKARITPPCPELVNAADSIGQRLKGKRVLLTGTTKGVGVAAQELFARHGAYVIGSGRTPGVAAANAAKIAALGLKAEGYDVDLSDPDAAKAWVDMAAERMGGIDVVVNNASKPEFAPFGVMTFEQWKKSLQNELDLVFTVTNAAWPHLIKAGGGSVINVSSNNGTTGIGNTPQAAHAAAKAGVIGLAKQLAAEGAPFGIRVNALSPGLIETPGSGGAPPEMVNFIVNEMQLTGRPLTPLDVAYGLLFLASDESRFITAINLPLDGGSSGAMPGPNF
ncbi:MAG TPA: SDR family NAD(P)-dependent oxidoreductase [Syntrophomonas sp.]|nr:SDR family NAD(P)-dependent oxidoreductase [Syntrophomonas sp.]